MSGIEGDKELVRLLKALPKELSGKAVQAAFFSGAGVIQKELKASAPVRSEIEQRAGRPPGFLRSQIKRQRIRAGLGVKVTAGKAFYWRFIDRGTSAIAATFWARDAVDRATPETLAKVREEIGKKAIKAAFKLGGKFKTSGLARKRRRKR